VDSFLHELQSQIQCIFVAAIDLPCLVPEGDARRREGGEEEEEEGKDVRIRGIESKH